MFSILHVCMHFFIAYQARPGEIGAIDANQRFLVIELNQISVDIICNLVPRAVLREKPWGRGCII